jgi:hypothetical protein
MERGVGMSPPRVSPAVLLVLTPLILTPSALATTYQILPVSQQQGPSNASAGASVKAASHSAGSPGGGDEPATPVPGSIEANSGGSGRTFTYKELNGETCQYVPTTGVCYGITPTPEAAEGPPAAQPPVSPAALASTAASRIALEAGTLQTSPSSRTAGLTGAASWFWLEPAPVARALTVGLRGERVTVTASAQEVLWSFGEGAQSAGGAGVPYRLGPAPADAVRHVYQTRCLPGDQGHDPSVLASCGAHGYAVSAEVVWSISYQASGPVAGSGVLPARTTTATISYPVSESRAFLTASGGGA